MHPLHTLPCTACPEIKLDSAPACRLLNPIIDFGIVPPYPTLSSCCDLLFPAPLYLQVAEHLPPSMEPFFLYHLHRHNQKGVVLSWAIPGQGAAPSPWLYILQGSHIELSRLIGQPFWVMLTMYRRTSVVCGSAFSGSKPPLLPVWPLLTDCGHLWVTSFISGVHKVFTEDENRKVFRF